MKNILFICGNILLFASLACAEAGQITEKETSETFEKHRSSLVRISVIEKKSQKQTTLGSGFFISADGRLITNYHVVSKLVYLPERYSLKVETADRREHHGQLLNYDVINDLALVGIGGEPPSGSFEFLKVSTQSIPKGETLYSLGNPLNLGVAIISGTFNGVAEKKYPERLHFTGAINSGMSGGPTVLRSGEVVGINVSSYGDEVSFLVPAKKIKELLQKEILEKASVQAAYEMTRDQLEKHQSALIDTLSLKKVEASELGHYFVPTLTGDTAECWSSSDDEEVTYESEFISCNAGEEVFIGEDIGTGDLRLVHGYVRGIGLNPFQFYSLVDAYLGSIPSRYDGSKRDFSTFRCKNAVTDVAGIPFKVWQCMRAYRHMPGLVDAVMYMASLDSNDSALISTYELRGVTLSAYQRFSREILKSYGVTGESATHS